MRFARVGLYLWYSIVGSVSNALLLTRIQSQLIGITASLIHEGDRLSGTVCIRRIDSKAQDLRFHCYSWHQSVIFAIVIVLLLFVRFYCCRYHCCVASTVLSLLILILPLTLLPLLLLQLMLLVLLRRLSLTTAAMADNNKRLLWWLKQ